MKVLIIVLSLVLFGCDKNREVWSVDCDSGFSTGDAIYATIYEGTISWQDLSRIWYIRKMLNGEICHQNKKVINNEI